MASVHQAAAKRKTAKKKFKGKYPGPDKYKGKPPPKKKKAAAKPAAKPAAKKAAPKPNNPALGAGVGTSTDSNGNLKLQTNADIENMVIQAQQEQQEAIEAANAAEGESLIKERVNKDQALDTDVENRTKGAGYMAARGMHGSAAQAASANRKQAYSNNMNQIGLTRQQESQSFKNAITSAASRKASRDAEIANARKSFTDEQSKDNPTVGSTPVNSGVTPLKATQVAAAKRKAAAKPKAKPAAKKKPYKGKHPGPG